ncbi:MAG: ParB/RepB/Spo0J family partition protein [Thermodesulfobacteriota bacterium]
MYLEKVGLNKIDFEDQAYRILNSPDYDKLEQSISDLGLVNPIKLIKTKKLFKVLAGWGRLSVLKKLDYKTAEASVYEENELTEETPYKIVYLDNKHRVDDLFKAELIRAIKDNCRLEDEEIIKDILPFIGLNPSTTNFNKYIKVAFLHPEIKQGYTDEHLTFEQLQMLSEIKDDGIIIDIYRNFLKKFRFNNNETRDLLKDILNIKNRESISIKEVSDTVYSRLDDNANKNGFRKELKKICYPALTTVEKVYSDRVNDLNLSGKTRVINHPYFESNELEIRIKFNKAEGLSDELNDLDRNIVNGNIEKLLGLIKEGK